MSTTVQNIVQRHTSTGAAKVQKDTEAIGKAQTRLGQASASAGRQFSAQATGLGGVVSAYAGAAANIFALTAAFFALQRAAEFEQIIAGTNALASTIGESGTSILNNIQEITKGQLSLVEAAQSANLALASGFSGEQIDRLTNVSLRASKALGRNLNDAFTRVVRGAAKLEPELLDELGIFTRIDPAVRKYADSVGRSVSSLTNFERRQAFVNEVIAEGEQKFRDVDTSTETAAVSLERLAAKIIETGAAFGGVIADSIAPFADFISGNLSNVFALFGVLARVVGAQAITVFGGAIDKATKAIVAFGERGAESINFLSRGFSEATKAAAQNAEAGIRFSRFGKAQEVQRRQLAQATLQEVAAGQSLTRAKYLEVRATLVQAAADQRQIASRIKNTAEKKIAREAIRGLLTQVKLLDVAQKAAIPGTNAFAVALRGVGVAAGFVGTALNRALGIITTVITVVSVLQLAIDGLFQILGFDNFSIMESLVGVFKSFISLLKGSIEQTKSLVSANREFIVSQALLGLKQEKQNEILKIATKNVTNYIDAIDIPGQLPDEELALPFETLKKLLFGKSDFEQIKKTQNAILELFEIISGGPAGTEGARKAGSIAIGSLEVISQETGIGLKNIIQFIMETRTLGETFGLAGNEAGVITLKIGQQVQALTEVTNGVASFKKGFELIGPLLTALIIKQRVFVQDLEDGLLNAEKAAQSVGAQEALILRLEKERTRLIQLQQQRPGSVSDARLGEIGALIEEAKIQKEILAGERDRLSNLEKIGKILDKVFGKPGEKLERRFFSGEINEEGKVALTNREKQLNIVKALNGELQRFKNAQVGLNADQEGLLKDREKEQRILKEKLNALQLELRLNAVGRGNLQQQRTLSESIKTQREKIKNIDKEIKKFRSDFITLEKNALTVTKQLVLERDKLAKTIETEIFNTRSKVLSLELKSIQLQEKNNMLIAKDALQGQKAITNELLAQNKARETFLKGIGAATREDRLNLGQEARDLKIALAGEDRRFAEQKAESDRKIADARTKLDVLKLEQDRKLFVKQIETTVKLIDQLRKFSRDIENASRRSRGLAPLSDTTGIEITINRNSEDLNKFAERFKKATDEVIQSSKDSNILTENLAKSSAARKETIAKNAADREFEALKQRESLRIRLFKGINKELRDNIAGGLNELFDAIAKGEFTLKSFREGFNQFLFNLLNDIRKQFLKETLIEPVSDFATGILKSAFSIEGSAGKASGKGKEFNFDPFVGLEATGGPIRRMAAGGMMRDRVPTLLEPGEFVMKRSSARSIGSSNLNAMNSTGQMAGNVSVNIVNQGTPQEATEQSEPRFDGEKFVIDIVTRDLRNNGPIRRSLRGAS